MGEAILLPHGYWSDGHHYREVSIRPLTGGDEEFLVESAASAPPVAWATDLLKRCVERMAGHDAVTRAALANLVVGDREALLWHARRLTLGDRLQAILNCPVGACGAAMDVDLQVTDILQAPYPKPQPEYESEYQGRRLRFRLPTGADLEAACGEPEGLDANRYLLERCMVGVHDAEYHSAEGSADWMAEVPALMERLDPQAELELALGCPECGYAFTTVLDAGTYVLEELAAHSHDLHRQIHTLALYYHWSESEILGLSSVKRHRYLGLLADSLSEAEP